MPYCGVKGHKQLEHKNIPVWTIAKAEIIGPSLAQALPLIL